MAQETESLLKQYYNALFYPRLRRRLRKRLRRRARNGDELARKVLKPPVFKLKGLK